VAAAGNPPPTTQPERKTLLLLLLSRLCLALAVLFRVGSVCSSPGGNDARNSSSFCLVGDASLIFKFSCLNGLTAAHYFHALGIVAWSFNPVAP